MKREKERVRERKGETGRGRERVSKLTSMKMARQRDKNKHEREEQKTRPNESENCKSKRQDQTTDLGANCRCPPHQKTRGFQRSGHPNNNWPLPLSWAARRRAATPKQAARLYRLPVAASTRSRPFPAPKARLEEEQAPIGVARFVLAASWRPKARTAERTRERENEKETQRERESNR